MDEDDEAKIFRPEGRETDFAKWLGKRYLLFRKWNAVGAILAGFLAVGGWGLYLFDRVADKAIAVTEQKVADLLGVKSIDEVKADIKFIHDEESNLKTSGGIPRIAKLESKMLFVVSDRVNFENDTDSKISWDTSGNEAHGTSELIPFRKDGAAFPAGVIPEVQVSIAGLKSAPSVIHVYPGEIDNAGFRLHVVCAKDANSPNKPNMPWFSITWIAFGPNKGT